MTVLPDASQPSSRRALRALRIGSAAAIAHAEPMGAVPGSAACTHAIASRAARRHASRIRDDHDDHDDRNHHDDAASRAQTRRTSAADARSTHAAALPSSERSRISIRLARNGASHVTTSAGCIALPNPPGSSPAHRHAGTAGLQRLSVATRTLSAEVETASDSELSEAAPKHGSLGQPAGGHEMQRALRHGDALAHLIGIVQVVQIAGAVHATANVLVLRPPAGTLFDSSIHPCRSV
ncbi:hypothetical protein QZM22_04840 [Burkholderia oklahomensis]|uniref:hypothetical protein n=1 Tax=Burkholderia oklahomensis TaxID=342113 RepID=UPI00265632B5|nr:hypothetical protein [Burkholderia oklahomensis]MDN7671865.1 hypothetical protein [Burkholderia oklahomensis]